MEPFDYVDSLLPIDPILLQVHRAIRRAGLPSMSVHPMLGQLLTLLARTRDCKNALEIGTFAGYSGICIARGLGVEGRLTTLEERVEHAAMAREHFAMAGVIEQVDLVVGRATDTLALLQSAGQTFDFFFIDADKTAYPEYLDWSIRLARPGALIVADNVLAKNRVADLDDENPTPTAMRTFNQALFDHPKLQATLLPVYDGFAIAQVVE